LRDESNRKGIRVVVEVKKDANVNVVVNKLFKHTQLQDSFGIIMLGLVKGQPQTLGLKEILENYLEHRQEVIRRATEHDLKIARDRLHIVEGLRIAIDNLDEIVNLIRSSKDRETARNALISRFALSEKQANAILDMRLAQLTGLERSRLEEEYAQLLDRIEEYLDILARPERVLAIIKEDLADIKKRYGDERRTEIIPDDSDSQIEDFIEDHEVMITLSNRGYVKRQPIDAYKSQRRGGKGVIAGKIRTEDAADSVVVTSVLANLLFFTNQGRVFSTKAYKIPESTRQAKGLPIINLIDLRPGEMVTTLVAARALDDSKHLIMVTKQGITKKVPLSAFSNIRRSGLIAVNLRENDELVGVRRVESGDRIMIASSYGYSITFDEKQVRPMGRTAAGVKGIRLASGDYVVGIDKYREDADVLLVTEKGYGKRTRLEEFKEQNRGGKGLKTIDVTDAFNIHLNLNLGNVAQSESQLKAIAEELQMDTPSLSARIVEEVSQKLLAEVNDMFRQWENEPAYKVWEVIHQRKFALDRVIGIGAAAPALVPALAALMQVESFVHEYSPVANALGAAVVRPTLSVMLHVDTQSKKYTLDPGGISGTLEKARNFQLDHARAMARQHLHIVGKELGMEDYTDDADFFLEEQFNMIRGWDRTGKLFEVGIQVAPGFIKEYEGVKI
jgi:DNA gyrase/topoisomerase IV subunit A